MKRKLFWIVPFLVSCSRTDRPSAAPGQPAYRTPNDLPNIVAHQAYESRLSIDGIALRDSTLYAATNVGLLEVRGLSLVRVVQWFADDNVVSGPWYDQSRNRVWIMRNHDDILLYQHDSVWTRVPLPKPPNGEYYTREDMLEGFRGISDSATFRLLGGGAVWRWSGDSAWIMEERPPTDALNATIGFGRTARNEVTVVTSGGCAYLPCTNQAYSRSSEGWQKPLHLAVRSVEDAVATSGSVFIRGGKGELVRIDGNSATPLTTPGPCEAIARTSTGQLIASFRGAGIFVLDSTWRKLFDDPTDPATGEQRAFIAEDHGRVALATTTVPKLTPGSSDKFVESGNLGLWIASGPKLIRIPLVP